MERNDFMNFARDLYFKREFSKNGVSGQEAMRNAILDALGENLLLLLGVKTSMMFSN